jgi:hypothetical protein
MYSKSARALIARKILNMSSATFFPMCGPTATFGPGLHNLEMQAQRSLCARGWSAPRAALSLQSLYRQLPTKNADVRCLLHLNGDVYRLCKGYPLPIFLDEVEAKYRDMTVMAMCVNEDKVQNIVVLNGHCKEELVPGSQNRGNAMQFAWALRWMFAKCKRGGIDRVYDRLLSDVD